MTPVPASARRRAVRSSNRRFRSSAEVWAWAFPSPARVRCWLAAIFCWCPASSEEPRSVSCFPWRRRASLVAHALLRAVSRLISTPSPSKAGRSHECERGTHECVRYTVLSLVVLAGLLRAQEPTLRVPVRLVVAPTSVTDRAGNFINGLTASDFKLYDNDVPQQVHEDGDFLPISMAIAIQTNLKKQAIERVRELGPLLGALVVGVGGEAAIFTFKDQLQVRQDFTPDLGRLTHALRRVEFSPGPNHVID